MDEPPATREPAPGGLALVQDFVNTLHLPEGDDDLGDAAAVGRWLGERGFAAGVTEAQRRRLLETREHLRVLLGVNTGQPFPDGVAAKLATLLDDVAIHPVVSSEGVHLASTAVGLDGFLAAVLAALVQATIDGNLRRLKVCLSDQCLWAFYDSSKNGCGAWCTMRVCGSRAKARAYRERRRDEGIVKPAHQPPGGHPT